MNNQIFGQEVMKRIKNLRETILAGKFYCQMEQEEAEEVLRALHIVISLPCYDYCIYCRHNGTPECGLKETNGYPGEYLTVCAHPEHHQIFEGRQNNEIDF